MKNSKGIQDKSDFPTYVGKILLIIVAVITAVGGVFLAGTLNGYNIAREELKPKAKPQIPHSSPAYAWSKDWAQLSKYSSDGKPNCPGLKDTYFKYQEEFLYLGVVGEGYYKLNGTWDPYQVYPSQFVQSDSTGQILATWKVWDDSVHRTSPFGTEVWK